MPTPTPPAGREAALRGADFRPACLHLPTVRLFWAALPSLLRCAFDIAAVDVSPEDIACLKSLAGERVLLTPNHPTRDEPVVLFALSRAAGLPFHYLSARENFDLFAGLGGRVLQRLGTYSVVRGTADRESFRATRDILAAPAGKLVIFPEGEVYSQNDTLLPFHTGVVQMAFWALEDARKGGDPEADILLLPVAVRYRFIQDMTRPIAAALTDLEAALDLPPQPDREDAYVRLRRIGIAVLETMEGEYGLKAKAAGTDDLTPRFNALKALLLDRAAGALGVTLAPDATLPEKMRTLMNAVNAVTQDPPSTLLTPYRDRLHRQHTARTRPLMQDLDRVSNWIAVRDDYVRARPTPERMADNIHRLEVEVFGRPRLHGSRRALIGLGEPLRLSAYRDAYRADKRATVVRLTHELEAAVQARLDATVSPAPALSGLDPL